MVCGRGRAQAAATYCILDAGGRTIQSRTAKGPVEMVLRELARIKDRFAIVYEASSTYGYLFDELSKLAAKVVAHPGHLRVIFRSKHKNDRIDTAKLANAASYNRVEQSSSITESRRLAI